MNKSSKRNSFIWNLAISFLAVVFSLIISGIIMLVVGNDPLLVFSAMIEGSFGSLNAIANTLSKAIPLILCGLSFAFAAKAGIFNIGGEGQLYLGSLAATVTAIAMKGSPKIIVLICSFMVAFIVSGALGVVLGFAKAKLQLSEVIVAIMLNYIVSLFCSWAVNGPLKPADSMVAQTEMINHEFMLSKLVPKTQLTVALLLAIILCFIVYFFFKYTRFGFNIYVVGRNRDAAKASGINVGATMIIAMCIAGGLSGFAGVTEVFGKYGRFIEGYSPGFGFTGIAVSVLAANNPFGVILTSILFGAMDAGAMKMSYAAGVSANMVKVIQGLVIIFVATPNIARMIIEHRNRSKVKGA